MIRSFLIVIGTVIPAAYPIAQAAEENAPQKQEPITYKKCVLAASESNTKWAQYREDVNTCRAKFNIPGRY